jgi:hypothetical protein
VLLSSTPAIRISGIRKSRLRLANEPHGAQTTGAALCSICLEKGGFMSDERKEKERVVKEEESPGKKHDDAEARLNDQDPGHRQKENQNKQKDDPLAA